AAPAFLAIANSYYEEEGAENLRQAEEQYKDFIVFFPLDPQADGAHMKVISINMERLRSENAKVQYRGNLLRTRAVVEKFIGSFPESDYRPVAEEMLNDINRELANQRISNITGYVVNEAGRPIKGVAISAVEKTVAGVQPAPVGSASSDEQGYFTLPGMPLDNEMEIHFAAESLAPLVYESSGMFGSPLRITMRELSIERIEIKGNRRIPEDTIRFYIQTKPGELYSPTRLASDVRSLYASNFFENVEVQERDGESGKVITFTVDEKLLIRSIQYIGNSSLTESEILEAYKENKVGLVPDSQFEYRKVMLAERILKRLLAERGKPQASVRVETETLQPSSIRLRFIIDEGGN
ncbi:MAG: surface antigen, partial [Acidobacteria bacterium]|nr:surface antigen [Acidobacteriota bacterium]